MRAAAAVVMVVVMIFTMVCVSCLGLWQLCIDAHGSRKGEQRTLSVCMDGWRNVGPGARVRVCVCACVRVCLWYVRGR